MKEEKIENYGTIEFDEEYYLNKSGLESLGFSSSDNEAIYNYLISQNRMTDGIKGLVFYDSVIHIRSLPKVFELYFAISGIDSELGRQKSMLARFFNKFFSGNRYLNVKLTGFFEIGKPYKYKGNLFYILTPHKHTYAYINNCLVEKHIPIHIREDSLVTDKENNITLPRTSSNESLESRIVNEYYFHEREIAYACTLQFPHKPSLSLPFTPDIFYARGNTEECFIELEELDLPSLEKKGDKMELKKADHRNQPTPKALEVMLTAVVTLLKRDSNIDDEAIIEEVKTLLPQGIGKGLSQSKMSGALSRGRATLGISHPERSKK